VKILPDESPALRVSAQDGHTRKAIVQLLLESGSITAADIGRRLSISAAGVRRHLDALVDSGDAEANPSAPWQQAGRGRPAKRFRLTAAGRAKLEHTYDDLASAAMRQLREIGGDEAVRTFARRRVQAILDGVERVDSGDDGAVAGAADQVADALTRAGYATTTARSPMWQRSFRSCARPSSRPSPRFSAPTCRDWLPSSTATVHAPRTCR
jgi:predicted ArsR family transcriptional regulator